MTTRRNRCIAIDYLYGVSVAALAEYNRVSVTRIHQIIHTVGVHKGQEPSLVAAQWRWWRDRPAPDSVERFYYAELGNDREEECSPGYWEHNVETEKAEKANRLQLAGQGRRCMDQSRRGQAGE